MKLKRKYLDYLLVGVLLLVPIMVLRSSLRERDELSKLDAAILRITSPLQAVATWVVGGMGTLWNDYVWLVDVEDENDELRALNFALRQELRATRAKAKRADLLEDVLEFKQSIESESVAARVVASSINSHFRVTRIRIDRGAERVAQGMAVMDARGLVGRISKVYGSYADVMLVSDPQSSIDVAVTQSEARGILSGLGSDTSYECQIEYLETGKKVEVGDEVVTSGLGDAIPHGISVGTITEVLDQEKGLYQRVKVKPTVDFATLHTLVVILAPPPAPDPGKRVMEPSIASDEVEAF